MQANPSLPKIFFRVISHYRVIDGEKNTGETQDFIIEATDAREAVTLAIAKLKGPFVASLQLTVSISHTAEDAE